MIEWVGVAGGALAILGCALALAALSRASWLAALGHERARVVLGRPGTQAWLAAAGMLFAGGQVILAGTPAARALGWVILGLFALQMALAILARASLARGARGGRRRDG